MTRPTKKRGATTRPSGVTVSDLDLRFALRLAAPFRCRTERKARQILGKSIARMESALLQTAKGRRTKRRRSRERDELLHDMRADGVKIETVAHFLHVLAVHVEDRVLRKDLTGMVAKIAARLPKRVEDYVQRGPSDADLQEVDRAASAVADPRLQKRLQSLVAQYRRNRPPTEQQIEQAVKAVYEADPRRPFLKRGAPQDIAWLKSLFWRDGTPRLVRRPHRGPVDPVWPAIAEWLVELLNQDLRSLSKAADYTGTILWLYLVDTGLLPGRYGYTFQRNALRAAVHRARRRPVGRHSPSQEALILRVFQRLGVNMNLREGTRFMFR